MFTIYNDSGSIPLGGSDKRMVKLISSAPQTQGFDTMSANALLDPGYLFKRAGDSDGSGGDGDTGTFPVYFPARFNYSQSWLHN
jgi:hypothetical protein